MTDRNVAVRAPVRWYARWLARFETVQGQIRNASLVVTAFSTFSLMLEAYGYGDLVVPIAVVGLIVGPIYVYKFSEEGVFNQKQRDKADLGTNYAGPVMRLSAEHFVRGMKAAELGRELTDEERDAIEAELNETFRERRDGIDLQQIDGQK